MFIAAVQTYNTAPEERNVRAPFASHCAPPEPGHSGALSGYKHLVPTGLRLCGDCVKLAESLTVNVYSASTTISRPSKRANVSRTRLPVSITSS